MTKKPRNHRNRTEEHRSLESAVAPSILAADLNRSYRDMASEKECEAEALEWSKALSSEANWSDK